MRISYIIILLGSLLLSQDRSVIFNTGSPDGTDGYTIDANNSIANRISVANDYVLEAMVFYMSAPNIESANIRVSLREDDNGAPGNFITDSAWEHQIDILHQAYYNLIVTTDLCIYLDGGNFYWWSIEAADESTNAKWIYSDGAFYNTATSEDAGETWISELGYAGAGGVWAEQIYEANTIEGDINFDFTTNVVDVVNLVGYILGQLSLAEDQIIIADLNHDGSIDVVDIVALVNLIIISPEQNPDFTLEDINPVSEYYSLDIGPSFFSNEVSCYYFGKQG